MPAPRKELNLEPHNLWYLVGLITADGNLSRDGRHIDITSKGYDFLEELKERLRLGIKIGVKNKNKVNQCYHIQIANKNLYEFLASLGLTPNKSFSQGQIRNIPDKFFSDFLRGVIDGDGCIRRWYHPTNKGEQWSLRVYSPSEIFLKWLKIKIGLIIKVKGRLHEEKRRVPRKPLYTLKYGKMAARIILKHCYYNNSLCLRRKERLAKECILSYVGWHQSKNIDVLNN